MLNSLKTVFINFGLIFFFTLILNLFPRAHAKNEWAAGLILKDRAPIVKNPEDTSEIIGTYPQGTSLILYYPKVNHYYAIYFKEPIKNHFRGWIHESLVSVSKPFEPPFTPYTPPDPLTYNLELTRPHFTFKSAFNSLDYRQSPLRSFTQESITGVIEGELPFFSDEFSISSEFSFTLFPTSTSIFKVNARFLRSNTQIHWHIARQRTLRISLQAGVSYLTSFIPDSAYGYQNFIFPRVFPKIEFLLSQRMTIETLISYMPFIKAAGKSPHEFLYQMTLFYHLMNQSSILTSIQYSDISFPMSSSLHETSQNTFHISFGYRY